MANRLRNFFHKHIQLANNAICALFLGLAFACALSSWFSAGDMTIIVPALTVGWLFACIGWWYAPGISKMGRNLWIAVSTVALVCEAIFLHYHFHNQTTVKSNLDNQILYTCQYATLPKVWPDDEELLYLEIIGPPRITDDTRLFAMYLSFIGGAQTQDDANTFRDNTFRCSITNFSSYSITSFKAKIDVAWFTIVTSPNGLTSGSLINQTSLQTPDFQMESATHSSAKFYIVNASKTLVEFTLPNTAVIKVVGSDEFQTVKLLRKENDFTARSIWPLEQYLKGLRSVPLPTLAPPQQPARK